MKKSFVFISFVVFAVIIGNSGCVHNVPLSVDVEKDIATQIHVKNKIHAKVGVYLPDNIKQYVYSQPKMGMIFQMDAGRYIEPISMKIISAIFSDVTIVNQLPPYNGDYTPDVEAVVKPEILYCYGDAVGTISGFIEARFKMRITAYDLRGEILWQDEQMGESRSEPIDMLNTFLNGMQKVGTIGYSAAFASAAKIVNNFNDNPPKELYSLLEIKDLSKKDKTLSDSELFEDYFKKGKKLYSDKNYHHALYAFNKAESVKPEDLASLFYSGACYTYIAQKGNAISKFDKIIKIAPKSQEAKDSQKWVNLKPLNIGIVLTNDTKLDKNELKSLVDKIFKGNKMYNLIDMNEMNPPSVLKEDNINFFKSVSDKNIQVIVYIKINDKSASDLQRASFAANKGDYATELRVSVKAEAFSIKKMKLYAEIPIEERDSFINKKASNPIESIKIDMITRGIERLIFKLIENNTF